MAQKPLEGGTLRAKETGCWRSRAPARALLRTLFVPWETAFSVSQIAPAGGERIPRKRNWLLAQPRFGGYAFHTKEDCCRRGDQYRPCPGCLVFLISLIEGSTRISVHISSFNTAFLTPFSHLPHFYLQKYPKPRIINFMFCFVTKIKCETEAKIRRCWEWDAGFGWTQRKRKGNAYE